MKQRFRPNQGVKVAETEREKPDKYCTACDKYAFICFNCPYPDCKSKGCVCKYYDEQKAKVILKNCEVE